MQVEVALKTKNYVQAGHVVQIYGPGH